MALAAKTPSLYKPKSKIRLRLGLTPPHPQTTVPSTAIAAPAARAPTKEEPSSAQSTRSFNHPTSTHTSPDDHSKSLNTSQITHSSRSRPDSRDAFALEISPSTQSTHSPHRANFDTISYATQSPASLALRKIDNPSYTSVSTNDIDPYPTPSPSSSPSRDTSVVSTANESATAHRPGIQSEDPTLTHPHVAEAAAASDHIFHLTDEQLSDRFNFVKEIGYGNWGSVWLCRPKHLKGKDEGPMGRLGRSAAAGGGSKSAGKVAIKLVHRSKSPTTSARVRALWGEMKIIRALRHEPHPSIIQFEAFVITPSYALVIMPFLADLIPVCLPPDRATPYFRQLCSAVGYLHERGITHNDIKPANVLLSYNDIPVLVDFGFAQKWDVGERGSFLSSISWGTPEYLDPQRAMGMPHDERASDVWSLGITMFEVLVGRTPFEEEEELDEEFHTPDDLVVYYERSRRGEWIGEWSFIPKNLQHLLRAMICPDPAYRMTAMQAYHHPSLQPQAASVIITPHFVRAAASAEFNEPLPGDKDKDKKKRKAKKREAGHGREAQPRAVTPALGESIKQHTSAPRPKRGDKDTAEADSPGKKVVVKKSREALDVSLDKDKEQDPTPTRKSKPAGSLKVKDLSYQKEQGSGLRSSDSQANDLSRQSSFSKTASTQTSRDSSVTAIAKPATQPTLTHHDSRRTLKTRDSNLSMATTSTIALTKEEAVFKAMRRLEGKKKEPEPVKRDVLGIITRPAPSPPRPRSLDSQIEVESKKKEDQRRSLGIEKRLMDVVEESPAKAQAQVEVEATVELTSVKIVEAQSPARADDSQTTSPLKPSTPTKAVSSRKPTPFPGGTPTKPSPLRDSITSKRQVSMASPPRPRLATRPTEVVADGRPFPAGTTSSTETLPFPILPMPVDDGRQSPLSELRERILSDDLGSEKHQTRVRQLSGDLIASRVPNPGAAANASEDATLTQSIMAVPAPNGADASGLGGRLDQLALWVKDVEKMVEDARKALAEGREPPISLPFLNMQIPPAPLPTALPTSPASTSSKKDAGAEHRFGVTPDKPDAIPPHLRTSSTQVEPATPPKWMSYEEAEERVKQANEWDEKGGIKRPPKKERPTVSHVLKLFGNDKAGPRAHTPEPMASVPLKSPSLAHTLRGAPSTPALRSSTSRQSSKPLTRKSESNLRNFNTMPTNLTFAEALRPLSPNELSPRRAVYEDLLQSEPGVVRQGDGWSSWSSGPSRGIKHPSSMVSLRERALAFLRDDKDKAEVGGTLRERNIVDLAQEVEKRGSRYGESGPGRRPATPGANSVLGLKGDGKKGIFGRFRGKFGKKDRDEAGA